MSVLVNNAGYPLRGAIEEVDLEAVKRMFDVNVFGAIRMIQAVAPSMRSHGFGRIVTIGFESHKLSGPANGAYSATKHAIEAVNDALRWELGPFGIAVALIEPGNIGTRFNETALSGSTLLLNRGDSPYAALYARFKAQTTRGYRDAIQHRRHVAGHESVVLVDEPTEAVPVANLARVDLDRVPRFGQRWGQGEGAMGRPRL